VKLEMYGRNKGVWARGLMQ